MRYIVLATAGLLILVSCKKDKYTTAPQIEYKSITSSFASNNPNPLQSPILTLTITDKEGDLGFSDGVDTSYVYIKNLKIPPFKTDSFKFPASLSAAPKKDFKADVEIALRGDGSPGSGVLASSVGRPRPFTDTLYFEVYVKDFAGNKSNVIKTGDPLYYVSP